MKAKARKGAPKPRRVILGTGYLWLRSDMEAVWLKGYKDFSARRQRLTIGDLDREGAGSRKVRLVAEVLK